MNLVERWILALTTKKAATLRVRDVKELTATSTHGPTLGTKTPNPSSGRSPPTRSSNESPATAAAINDTEYIAEST